TRPGHRSRGLLPAPSLFGFAPGGVCRAVAVARNAVRSYRTFSPLPRPQPWRSVLCGTVPEVSPLARRFPGGRYPAPHVHGARTFLPGDLSVLAGAAVRPTDMLSNAGVRLRRQALRRPRDTATALLNHLGRPAQMIGMDLAACLGSASAACNR